MDKWLRNTNIVKIVALGIAILLWVVVHLDLQENNDTTTPALRNTTVSNVMVQAVYDDTQYSIVSIEPKEVTVVLKGKDSAIRQISPKNLQIKADLSKLAAGTYELPVKPDEPLPAGVTAEVTPDKVRVVMEEKQMKEVPVLIQVTGTPANGYKAGQPVVNPGRVYVTVPSSMVDTVDSARGEISIDKATGTVNKKIKLSAYDKKGNELRASVSPPVAEVEVPVTLPFKTMPLQIKWTGQPARGYAVAGVQQSVEQITVYGPQAVLDKMEIYEGLEVDISGIKEDRVYSLDIPVKNKELQIDPVKVEVKVNVVPSVTKTLDNIPISFNGLNDSLQAKFLSPESGTLNVTVEGTPGAIDKLRAQDLKAAVNVGSLQPGRYDLNANVGLPPFIKRTDDAGKVSVEISQKTVSADRGEASPTPQPTPSPSPSPQPSAAAAGDGKTQTKSNESNR